MRDGFLPVDTRPLTIPERLLVGFAWAAMLGLCGLIVGLILVYGTPILSGHTN